MSSRVYWKYAWNKQKRTKCSKDSVLAKRTVSGISYWKEEKRLKIVEAKRDNKCDRAKKYHSFYITWYHKKQDQHTAVIHIKKGLSRSKHKDKNYATQGFTEKYNKRKKEKTKHNKNSSVVNIADN